MPSAGSLAMRFGEALRAIVPQPAAAAADGAADPLPALDGAAVAALLLAGHHPALDAPMRRAPPVWEQVGLSPVCRPMVRCACWSRWRCE